MTKTGKEENGDTNSSEIPGSKMEGSLKSAHPRSFGYEIRVKDHLETYWFEWFEGWSVTNLENGEVILISEQVDQSKLHGTLNKIRGPQFNPFICDMCSSQSSDLTILTTREVHALARRVKMRILIIDPRSQACQSRKALLDACYQNSVVRQAVNACEALHFLEEFLPEIILVDVRMPDRVGLNAIQQIKAKFKSILLIVLSMDPGLQAETLAVGADAFISKADPPEKLWEAFKEGLPKLNWNPGAYLVHK